MQSNLRHPCHGINIQGTVTGRISSHDPALRDMRRQSNVPKSAGGMCLGLLNLDLSTLEQRLLAEGSATAQFPYGR